MASFGEISSEELSISKNINSYYTSVYALTPKVEVNQSAQATQSASPVSSNLASIAIFAPLFIFFVLFLSVLGLQLIRKARTIKNISTAVLIAFIAASIPLVLPAIERQTLYQAKAGPDEVPRYIRIVPATPSKVLVLWTTDAEKIGAVRYSISPFSETTSTVVFGDNGIKTIDHTVQLDRLQKGKEYDLEIFSGTTWYTEKGKPIRFLMKN